MLEPIPHARPTSTSTTGIQPHFGGFETRPLRADTARYMKGDCGYMSLAMSRLMPGSQIWKLGIGHFAVEDKHGSLWDIRGKMTLEQAWSGLAGPIMTPIDYEGVIAELNTGVYGDGLFTPSRVAKARIVVKQLLGSLSTTASMVAEKDMVTNGSSGEPAKAATPRPK